MRRSDAIVVRGEQTRVMASKYDQYWEQKLALVRDKLGSAASSGSARVGVPGLRDLGARQGHVRDLGVRDGTVKILW